MKTVCKKLLCLMLVAMMLVSAVPFAFAATGDLCEITLSPYSGNLDLSANKVTLMVDEGYTITETDVRAWATNAWAKLGYEFKSTLLGADGTIAMPDTVIPVEVTVPEGSDSTPSKPAPSKPAPDESKYGTLTVYVMQYDANNNAKDVGTVNFSGESSYTIGKALAEECFEEVGIVNYEEYKWQDQSGTLDMTNGKSYEATLLVDPIRTPGNRKIVTLTINHNRGNGNDDRQTVETLAGTKILDVLSTAEKKDYFDKPTRKGYRLAGYSFDVNCSDDINRDDVINEDMTIYCEWESDSFAGTNNPGFINPGNNKPGYNKPGYNKPGYKPGFNPGNIFDWNEFPGNGHNKPHFNFETVELTVVYNFPDNHRFMGRTSETFTVWRGSDILDALTVAESMGYYEVPTRDGYTLAGYSFDKECKNDVNRDDVIDGDLTIYCEWEKSYVTLRVYTNGDTKYPDRTFDLSAYAMDGKITQTEVEKLLDTKYSAKSGYTLTYYGLFTDKTWNNGDYDRDDAVSSIKVNAFGKTNVYVMVKNVKKAVADSSNPKTGDNIMIAVGTLTLSAAALISIIELKKRKMI